MDIIDILRQHYAAGGEEGRLEKDKSHSLEFITTKSYIDRYLKPEDRILEIGAATGYYSRHYATAGYEVDAVELLECNIELFRAKLTEEMKVTVRQGNALDLHSFGDNTFDVTLCFGPLYHLYTEEDKRKCVEEAIRVTKPGGILFFAYISNDAVFVSENKKDWNRLVSKSWSFDESFRYHDNPEEIFSLMYPQDFERIMKDYPTDRLHTVAADGISPIIAESVNTMTDEQFEVWKAFHLHTCEKENLLGYSTHILYICRKDLSESHCC